MIWKDFWLEILNGPRLRDLEGFLVGIIMVRCLGDQIEFWLGSQENDVARSTRQVRGRVMCGLGVLAGLVDDRVLRDVKTKVFGSCAPRNLH